LKTKYGVTRQEYNNLHEAQEGKCAICKEKETKTRQGKLIRLSLDHCHSSGKHRGLLCSKCNTAIGLLNEDEHLLEEAIAYLAKHKKGNQDV